ncbi:MAG TPA: heterodisulfide reductase-related iron-sulfur binding cluster [Longimicrobiales bacterium]
MQSDAAQEFEKKMLACVHCGFCLTACPTYQQVGDEADSPRGRIYLMRAAHEGRLQWDDAAVETHLDRCLGCRACEPVCPSGVEYGWLLERARDQIAKQTGTSFSARALLVAFGNRNLSRVASAFSRVARASRVPGFLARALPRGLGRLKFANAMLAASSPHEHSSVRSQVAGENPAAIKVALLLGCVQEGLFARVNRATEEVLRVNGCEVVPVKKQACCGALHAHSGDLDGARARARHNIAAFEAVDAQYIIVNAAGCGAVMKEYGELLAHDPEWVERARVFTAKVRDVSEFLNSLQLVRGAPLDQQITYDAPCHLLHAQRITTAPLDVLRQVIPDVKLVPLPGSEDCCGGAGIYGLLHQDLGGRILRDKIEAVTSTGADVVTTPNPGCMMQIGAGLIMHGSDMVVTHPVELLATSYRKAGLLTDG